jgi:hypothetical protein
MEMIRNNRIALSVPIRLTASDYFVGIFKHLAIALSVLLRFTFLITPLASSSF